MPRRSTTTMTLTALLAACAAVPAVPEALRPAPGAVPLTTLSARGVQVYECRPKKDDARAAEWAFVAPEAELFERDGRAAGTHFAGPRWQAADGSRVVGSVAARADAPAAGAIPWLLLTTRSDGPAGRFAAVTAIQRIRTAGGVAPAAGCTPGTLGQMARVPYTADYVLFTGP